MRVLPTLEGEERKIRRSSVYVPSHDRYRDQSEEVQGGMKGIKCRSLSVYIINTQGHPERLPTLSA